MRNPNGYGGVTRLPGNRRRPFRARVTVGWEYGGERRLQRYATLGYYATHREALIALAEYNSSPVDIVTRKVTFKSTYDSWSPAYFEKFPSTRRVTECSMDYCKKLWDKPISEIRTSQLQSVIDAMSDKSRAYQSKVRSLMHMLYRWCMSRDLLDKDYSQYVELPADEAESRRRVFTGEEIALLWQLRGEDEIPGEPSGYRGRGMLDSLLVLLYTGMRIGELLTLRREHIHLAERWIDLHGTKTKAARRSVPLHRDILPVIEDMLERPGKSFFLSTPDMSQMTYSQYKYSWFDKVMPALGLEHTPHDTRHTFVSALDSAGINRSVVKFIVGHSQSGDVTDRYTHKNLQELITAIDKLKY